MVTVRINQDNNYRIQGCFCQPISGIRDDVKKSLKSNEHELTAEKAQKILRKIEIKSKVQSFFTKPAVAISLTLTAAIGGYIATAFSVFSVALLVLGITFAIGGSFLFSMAVKSACDGSLHRMSEAYAQKAEEAKNYIQQINAAKRAGHNVRVTV